MTSTPPHSPTSQSAATEAHPQASTTIAVAAALWGQSSLAHLRTASWVKETVNLDNDYMVQQFVQAAIKANAHDALTVLLPAVPPEDHKKLFTTAAQQGCVSVFQILAQDPIRLKKDVVEHLLSSTWRQAVLNDQADVASWFLELAHASDWKDYNAVSSILPAMARDAVTQNSAKVLALVAPLLNHFFRSDVLYTAVMHKKSAAVKKLIDTAQDYAVPPDSLVRAVASEQWDVVDFLWPLSRPVSIVAALSNGAQKSDFINSLERKWSIQDIDELWDLHKKESWITKCPLLMSRHQRAALNENVTQPSTSTPAVSSPPSHSDVRAKKM